MEKRVTCPNCQHAMNVKIWSDTLTQVLKCADCNKKFTYDPSKELPAPPEAQAEVSPGPQESITPPPPAESQPSPPTESQRSPTPPPQQEPESPPPSPIPSGPRETSKSVACPRCTSVFQAGLPDNDKQVLTTQCPECEEIFSFDRSAPPAVDNTVTKPEEKAVGGIPGGAGDQLRPPTEDSSQPGSEGPPPGPSPSDQPSEPSAPDQPPEPAPPSAQSTVPDDDEDFAIPLALKEKMRREQEERDRETGLQADDFSEEDGPFDGDPSDGAPTNEGSSDEPPSGEDPSGDGSAPMELAPDPARKKGPRGRLLSVTCPYCSESFGTPAPKTKGKVSCPICEQEFVINSRGELVAKKAMGGFTGGLAKVVGVDAMRNYQDTVRESIEGAHMLKDSQNVHHHMRSHSGKAGFLLMVVAILGILFAGSLLLSIPDSGEDDTIGVVLLTGNVKSGLDLLADAQVNLSDSGRQTTTNSEGEFQFEYVPTGDHTVEITASGKGKLIVHFTIGNKETKQGIRDLKGLVVPEEGVEEQDLREERVQRAGLVLGIQAAFIFVISLLALMGGLLAVQAKRFHATLFLAALSVVSIGFFIGMAMAIMAIFLVILGRKEFIS